MADNGYTDFALTTEKLEVGTDAIARTPSIFSEFLASGPASVRFSPLVIADDITWKVAGREVQESLAAAGLSPAEPFIFPGTPMLYADEKAIAKARDALARHPDCRGVAVGAGSINDIVKAASGALGQPYMVVATAPSVDGYTSAGAAVSIHGFKQTVQCPAPVAVVADTGILSEAPYDMIAAGYADLAAKVPAGADWLVANFFGLHPIHHAVWDMIQTPLHCQVRSSAGIAARDHEAISSVFTGLCNTGFAMQRMHDSRPASGAEHLMSHVWEMDHLEHKGIPVSHGFKVALGTLAATAFYEEFFGLGRDYMKNHLASWKRPAWEDRERDIHSWLDGQHNLEDVLRVSKEKFLTQEAWDAMLGSLIVQWGSLELAVRKQLIPFSELRKHFVTAGCPVEPADIGLSREEFRKGLHVSGMIRNRFTILDLMFITGVYDELEERLMSSGQWFGQFA